jgi:hypothetical protein
MTPSSSSSVKLSGIWAKVGVFCSRGFHHPPNKALEAEVQVFRVGINFADAAKLTGTCAAELAVRRTPDAGRYILTDAMERPSNVLHHMPRPSRRYRRTARQPPPDYKPPVSTKCFASPQSDRHPRAVRAGGRSRTELSDRRVIDAPVCTPSINRRYGRCDPVTFTKIGNSLRASRQEIIVHYHEAAIASAMHSTTH